MPRTARSPALWPWFSLLVVSLGVIGAIAWIVLPRALSVSGFTSSRPVAPPQSRPAVSQSRSVRLFFPQESSDAFKEQERELTHEVTLTEDVRAVLSALANGNGPGVQPPLPTGLELHQVFLDAVGILYLDFGKEIRAVLASQDSKPELALLAIVTTLTTNFSEIKRVQFLSEGQELTEVLGGMDLRRPLAPRFPGEESLPMTSRGQEAE